VLFWPARKTPTGTGIDPSLTSVTDGGLGSLKKLDLRRTKVTDAGFGELKKKPPLDVSC
jgi:hypothetical protein